MKNFFNSILFLAVMLSSSYLHSQSFNFYGGFNSSNIAVSGDSADAAIQGALPGFHVGTSVIFKINDLLTFQPGIIFESKGSQSETIEAGLFNSKITFELYYLNIPLNLSTSFEISEKLSAFATAGPYIGLGISGNFKSEISSPFINESETTPLEFGNDILIFDFGFGLGGGLQYENFLLGVSYDFGVPNIILEAPEDNFARNRVFRISLGYSLEF